MSWTSYSTRVPGTPRSTSTPRNGSASSSARRSASAEPVRRGCPPREWTMRRCRSRDRRSRSRCVSAIDLSRLPRLEGHRIDGILGYDFISRYVVAIDYARHELRIYDQPAFHYDGPGVSVPVTLINRFPHIDADVKLADGETIRGRMVIDVGSNWIAVAHESVRRQESAAPARRPDGPANGRRRSRRLDDVGHRTHRVALDRRHRAGAPAGESLRRLGRRDVGVELVGGKHRRRDPAAIHRVSGLSGQAHDLRAERDDCTTRSRPT